MQEQEQEEDGSGSEGKEGYGDISSSDDFEADVDGSGSEGKEGYEGEILVHEGCYLHLAT